VMKSMVVMAALLSLSTAQLDKIDIRAIVAAST